MENIVELEWMKKRTYVSNYFVDYLQCEKWQKIFENVSRTKISMAQKNDQLHEQQISTRVKTVF